MKQLARILIVVLAVLTVSDAAFAQRRGGGGRGGGRGGGMGGGGGGGFSRGAARPSINSRPRASAANRANINRRDMGRTDIGRGNVNRNDIRRNDINRNDINRRDINNIDNDFVNINTDSNWGWDGCCHYDHPIAAGVAVGAAAAVTAAAVGSVVYSLPPACTSVYVDGYTYENCGGTYYQPQYVGTSTSYIVVDPPH